MARTVQRFRPAKATIKLISRDFPLKPLDEQRAIFRAQDKNRRLAVERVRVRAQMLMNGVRHEPQRDNVRPMIDYYRARVNKDLSFSLFNPTIRGRAFEAGAKSHPIAAIRGQFLKFNYGPGTPFVFTPMVEHPGQSGRYPMRQIMEESVGDFAQNVAEAIQQEFARAS